MQFNSLYDRNQNSSVYIGNLDAKVSEELLWELMTQCGIVKSVYLPKDNINNEHQGFAFVEFYTEDDADYAIKIMHLIKLFNRPIKVNKATQEKRTQEVGANLYVGNLDPNIDEQMLFDQFGQFGVILAARIVRDPETGYSKKYAFVSYDNFESSDAAISALNGQFFHGKQLRIQYAFKANSKTERHGSQAERLLAANKPSGQQNQSSYYTSSNYLNMVSQQSNYQQMPMQDQLYYNDSQQTIPGFNPQSGLPMPQNINMLNAPNLPQQQFMLPQLPLNMPQLPQLPQNFPNMRIQ